jgi:hypothetical protein
VGVHVDEAGAEHQARPVDLLGRLGGELALDGGDPVAAHPDVRPLRRALAGIHLGAADENVEADGAL